MPGVSRSSPIQLTEVLPSASSKRVHPDWLIGKFEHDRNRSDSHAQPWLLPCTVYKCQSSEESFGMKCDTHLLFDDCGHQSFHAVDAVQHL